MELNKIKKSWYKNKLYVVPLIIIVGVLVVSAVSSSTPTTSSGLYQSMPAVQGGAPAPASQNNSLSNDTYYMNVSGNSVHSPAYSTSGSIPSGATAQCGDGTYSFSQHRSGTCSHHGGVSQWLQ